MRLALLLAIVGMTLLSACGQRTDEPTFAGTGEAAGSRETAAVLAFKDICSRLDTDHIRRRAVHYGFSPLRNELLPSDLAERMRQEDLKMLARRDTHGIALLFFGEAMLCELTITDVALGAVDAEFGRMLNTMAADPSLAVDIYSRQEIEARRLPIRRGATVLDLELLANALRVVTLRISDDQGSREATMTARSVIAVAPRADRLR